MLRITLLVTDSGVVKIYNVGGLEFRDEFRLPPTGHVKSFRRVIRRRRNGTRTTAGTDSSDRIESARRRKLSYNAPDGRAQKRAKQRTPFDGVLAISTKRSSCARFSGASGVCVENRFANEINPEIDVSVENRIKINYPERFRRYRHTLFKLYEHKP